MKRTRLILFLLICGSFFFPHISVSQDLSKEGAKLENWNDYASDSFAGGTGAEDDPYLIATAEQLAFLAKTVNGYYQGMTKEEVASLARSFNIRTAIIKAKITFPLMPYNSLIYAYQYLLEYKPE